MKKVIILRGPSGAGKSTVTKEYPNATVISADDFFMQMVDFNGNFDEPEAFMPEPTFEYKFDVAKLSEAHAQSVKLFTDALKRGDELVIVDNTNIKHWQFAHYIGIAELAGYNVEVVSIIGFTIEDIKLCASRNAHNVPIDVVAKMFYEFEPYENETVIPIKH
jgi:predicted kinase